MSHGKARTTVHGRFLMVKRHQAGMLKIHIAAGMGASRKCVDHWIARYEHEGGAGLRDRSYRPRTAPTRTCAQTEQKVLVLRTTQRRGRDWIGPPYVAGSPVEFVMH